MRKGILLLFTTLLSALATYAQGTINFSNGAAGVNAPVRNAYDQTLLAGTGYIAQLFAGPVGTTWDSLTPVTPTVTFSTGLSAGYFFGGIVTIPNVPAGSPAAYQVRVWSANFATWDIAWAAFQNPSGQVFETYRIGVSGWDFFPSLPRDVGITPPLGGLSPPPNLLGLQPFVVYSFIPEPSTLMLGLVGTGVWLLSRRWADLRSEES